MVAPAIRSALRRSAILRVRFARALRTRRRQATVPLRHRLAIRRSPPEHRPAPVDDQQSGRDWMHRCQRCGTVTPPRMPTEAVVVETRPCTYPFREKAQREVRKNNRLWRSEHDDPGGVGREIVREIRVCPPCKLALAGEVDQQHG